MFWPTRRVVFLAAAVLVAIATPLSAQSVLYQVIQEGQRFGFPPLGPVRIVERAWVDGELGAIQREASVPGIRNSSPVVTFDGRFVAWLITPGGQNPEATANLAYFDRITGVASIVPGLLVPRGTLVGDPTALRLYVLTGEGITVIEVGGTRFVPVPLRFPNAISHDRGELYMPTATTPDGFDIVVLSGSGTRVLSRQAAGEFPTAMSLSKDGSRLYLATSGNGPTLYVLDTATGTELLKRQRPEAVIAPFLGTPVEDDRIDRLFVPLVFAAGPTSSGAMWLLSRATLNEISTASTDSNLVTAVFVDESQPTVLSYSVGSGIRSCDADRIHLWSDAPAATQSIDAQAVCAAAVVAMPPAAPSDLQHTIAGRTVTLSWTAGHRSPDFQIEAGTSSGAADIATLRSNGLTTVSFGNVPPGTYFVRVRAVNAVGLSAVSNEVRIDVP